MWVWFSCYVPYDDVKNKVLVNIKNNALFQKFCQNYKEKRKYVGNLDHLTFDFISIGVATSNIGGTFGDIKTSSDVGAYSNINKCFEIF